MPFLRFTRDKRGYETTALVHASRRHGRAHQQILYWFRTPPGVKVGRPALDQEAIRWIEEHNPDIDFDWPRILQAQPTPAEEPKTARRAKPGRSRDRQRQIRESAPAVSARPPAQPTVEPSEPVEDAARAPQPQLKEVELEELEPEREDAVQMPPAVEQAPALESIESSQLVRLRARYSEILARIAERGGDAPRIEALRAQAEALNPDTWVTADEVRKGQEEFEARIRDLRSALGLRRRRRSRRGGRRRRREEPAVTPNPQTAKPSNQSEGAPQEDDEDDDEGYTEPS